MQISTEEVHRLLAATPLRKARTVSKADASGGQTTEKGQEAVSVEISTRAQEVQQVKQALDQVPDVRIDRVMHLKSLIETGKYQVSGEEIADLMIRRTLADNTAV